ncbi:MAG: hypothetical protein M1839_003660 [Geoglossum umbratile]|nr:MAG: hypothetical protein M1839_003660 [Geoglossum umbratile]
MSAPDYKALFEAEQRKREQAEAEAAELRKLARNTTLPEYLDFCHTYLFQRFTVRTNKERTTQGNSVPGVEDLTHPHFICPWADFLKIQDSTWKRLRRAYPPVSPRPFDPLASLKSCGNNSISKRLLASELDVSFLQHVSVENPVSDILSYLHTLPDVQEEFGLKSTGVVFDNPPNALSVADEAIQKRAQMARTRSTPILCTPTPPGHTKADRICVYTTEVNGRPTNRVAFTIEHLPPHKITLDLLRLALRPDCDAIRMDPLMGHVRTSSSEDEPSYSQYKADTTVARTVTQAYSNMIAGKTCFGYITTSEAFIFLYISPDFFPSAVYYHLVEPRSDVEVQMTGFPGTELYLNWTAVGQVLAFSLLALELSSKQLNSRLTSLPPELRHQILAELELDQLSALVHASSVFYRDYRCNRRSILTNCLQVTLRDVAVDACAVFQSSPVFFEGDQRALAHKSQFTKHLTEDQAIRMAAFHSSIIMPLASRYVNWAMTNLPKDLKRCPDYGPLSKTEETQVLRALYRFQLCCNIFGETPCCWASLHYEFRVMDILKWFLGLFEPWEVEEMVCIHAFAKEKLYRVLSSVQDDLPREDFSTSGTKRAILQGVISSGLGLLHTLISIVDHKELVDKVEMKVTHSRFGFLDDAWSTATQYRLHNNPPYSHRQQKQQHRDRLLFTGDGDSETDGPRPNLGWVLECRCTYSNKFGDYIDDDMHKWR